VQHAAAAAAPLRRTRRSPHLIHTPPTHPHTHPHAPAHAEPRLYGTAFSIVLLVIFGSYVIFTVSMQLYSACMQPNSQRHGHSKAAMQALRVKVASDLAGPGGAAGAGPGGLADAEAAYVPLAAGGGGAAAAAAGPGALSRRASSGGLAAPGGAGGAGTPRKPWWPADLSKLVGWRGGGSGGGSHQA
jgi:hypothetical protein